jgi:adenylate cyclase
MDADGEKEPINIPLVNNSRGWAYIKHYGPLATFDHIPFVNAYDDKNLPEKLPEILLMGATATGTTDILASPFARDYYAVEHLAAMTENIIRQDFMRRPETAIWYELGALIVSGILFALILRKASAIKSLLFVVTFISVAFVIDRIFLFGKGYWFYLGTLYVQTLGIFVSVLVYKYFTEEREKKKVKGAFQHYLNPGVINQILENPDMLKLGGEKKELSVFFSDVRGFSTISETLSPEGLTQLLNEYFTPMTQIILDSGGMLDKYIGDAIMAVWGAPLPMNDHADRAVASCLRMIDALELLRASWKTRNMPVIDIGCGVNTGEMTVGNMGGDQRFDYTVMGDSVNLASRLEGTTKEYKTRIIISEYTKAAIRNPSLFVLRELDLIVVKGKTEPVKIFDVMHFQQQFRQRAEEIQGMFAEGLQAYRAQDWNKAEERFHKILTLDEKDGPTIAFLERCKYLREHSPGDNWNGVWVMKTK